MTITLEKLIAVDPSYHIQKKTNEVEVERVNEMIEAIANTRSAHLPMPDDIIKYTNNAWEYNCNEQEFSTKNRDRLHVNANDKHLSSYKYFDTMVKNHYKQSVLTKVSLKN